LALTAQQIVSLATAAAKAPGFHQRAGMLLNSILSDLCQTYDLDIARGVVTFNLALDNGTGNGSGPYPLPADYLRCDPRDVFYTILGVKYVMIPYDLAEFDALVQQAGIASYPDCYATDLSLQNSAVPVLYVWPPASGAYPVTVRYRRQMPDIDTPETSAVVPWFPNTSYLITRLTGELMRITDDERYQSFLGTGSEGAQGILDRFLKLTNDKSDRAITVSLDRRRFGTNNFNRLPNTKEVGF
jgi:hypothetical protein